MAITDLTGTKWLMNDTISMSSGLSININFKDDELNEYVAFEIIANVLLNYFNTPTTRVFAYSPSNGWYDEKYKTIKITGGEDVTDSTFISWLESNATQIMPTPYIIYDNDMEAVANAIRLKGNTSSELLFPSGFVSAIENINDIPQANGVDF